MVGLSFRGMTKNILFTENGAADCFRCNGRTMLRTEKEVPEPENEEKLAGDDDRYFNDQLRPFGYCLQMSHGLVGKGLYPAHRKARITALIGDISL